MQDTVNVKGLSDLAAFLDQLAPKLQKNVMRQALRAGAMVIRNEAKLLAPVAPPNAKNARLYGGYAGALRDSIRVSTSLKGKLVFATIKAGGKKGKADAYYANMVEFGTSSHVIKGVKSGILSFGDGFVRQVDHPGAKAHPFMRPALDGRAQDAVIAAAEYMKERLSTKEGLNTAGVMIEGDAP